MRTYGLLFFTAYVSFFLGGSALPQQSTGRTCLNGLLNPSKSLHVFLYLDGCTSETTPEACASTTQFGSTLSSYLRDDFGLQANTSFLAAAGCGCPNFTDIGGSTPDETDFTPYDPRALSIGITVSLPTNGGFSNFSNSILNHVNGTTTASAFDKLAAVVDIFVCGEGGCPASSTFKVPRLSNIQDLNPLVVIREFACGEWKNTVPIPSWTSTSDYSCACECTVGHKWTTDQCVADAVPHRGCPWMQDKCYTLKLSQLNVARGQRSCNIEIVQGLSLPQPGDNYVYNHQNAHDVGISVEGITPAENGYFDRGSPLGPFIQVDLSVAPNIALYRRYFNWNYYSTNKTSIFDGLNFQHGSLLAAQADHTGHYRLRVVASDYVNPQTICSAQVNIIDDLGPRAHMAECPSEKHYHFLEPRGQVQETLHSVRTQIAGFFSWVSSRMNDPCGFQSTECDIGRYEQDFFCSGEGTSFCSSKAGVPSPVNNASSLSLRRPLFNATSPVIRDYFRLLPQDVEWMKLHIQQSLLDPIPGKPSYCVKTIELQHTFRDLVRRPNCEKEVRPKVCQSAPGDANSSCSFKSSVTYSGRGLFGTDRPSILPEVVRQSSSLSAALSNPEYSDPQTTINFYVHHQCKAVGADGVDADGDGEISPVEQKLCSIERALEELVHLKSHYDPDALNTQVFPCAPGGINGVCIPATPITELVHFRYQVGNGDWKKYSPNGDNRIVFMNDVTSLKVEAWTACGDLSTPLHANVVLHLHRTFEICPSFPSMFIQRPEYIHGTLKTALLPQAIGFCNTPHSDFADLVFQFNPQGHFVPKQSHAAHANDNTPDFLQYTFKSLRCSAGFVNSNGSIEVLYEQNSSSLISRDYAVIPPNNPTQRHSLVSWACIFTYTAFNGLIDIQRCSQLLEFHDCDQAHFATCQPEEKFNQVLPYEACNGNRVHWDGRSAAPTQFMPAISQDQQCNQDCGAYTCESLIQGVEDGIKRCVPGVSADRNSVASPEDVTEFEADGNFINVQIEGNHIFAIQVPVRGKYLIRHGSKIENGKIAWDEAPVDTSQFEELNGQETSIFHLDYHNGHLCATITRFDNSSAAVIGRGIYQYFAVCRSYPEAGTWEIKSTVEFRKDVVHTDIQVGDGAYMYLSGFGHPGYIVPFNASALSREIDLPFNKIAWDHDIICGIAVKLSEVHCLHSSSLADVSGESFETNKVDTPGLVMKDLTLANSLLFAVDTLNQTYAKRIGFSEGAFQQGEWLSLDLSYKSLQISYDGSHLCATTSNPGILCTTIDRLSMPPISDVQDPTPATNTTDVQAPAPASNATDVPDPAPAANTTDVQAPAPASNATDVQDPAAASNTTNVQAPAPASNATDVQDPAPASNTTDVQAPAPASNTSDVQDPAPTSNTTDVQDPSPASNATDVEAPAPASNTTDVQDPSPASNATDVQDPAPAANTTDVQDPVPALNTTDVMDLAPATTTADIQDPVRT